MAPHHKSRFWRICRLYFRRLRITVWLLMLCLMGGLLYLNQVGLPAFLKKPLLETLRTRGVELQFSRLRLRWYEGIVAENVRFGRADERGGPRLTAAEVQVRLNFKRLSRLQLQVDSIVLRQGKLVLPIAETNQPPRQLSIEKIQAELSFLPGDQWALEHFNARFAGAHIILSGALTNASAIREWRLFQAQPAPRPSVWHDRLLRLADELGQVRFSEAPEIRLEVRGDARNLQSFTVRLSLNAPDADTRWGRLVKGRLAVWVLPATSNELLRAEARLEAALAQTPWVSTTNLQLSMRLTSLEGQTNMANGDLVLEAEKVQTPWGEAVGAIFTGQWVHSLANPIPLSGQGELKCSALRTRWGSAKDFVFLGRLSPPVGGNGLTPGDVSWGWWTNLQPYALDWQCRLSQLQSPQAQVEQLTGGGSWRAPELTITNLHAQFDTGRLDAGISLDVETRSLKATVASDFDLRKIAPLLPEGGRHWLEQFSWDDPPRLRGTVALVLPAWTNRQPDWRAEAQPTLRLEGEFDLQRGAAYHQVRVSSAHSHFIYSNMVWRLPDLTVIRPEGRLEAEHRADDRTKDYYWRVSSAIDPRSLRPLLDANAQRGLDLITFSEPPAIQAEIWGRFHERERTGVRGRVALTNFAFRGEAAASLQTSFQYTNARLAFFEPRIERRPQQHLSAAGLMADFNAQRVYLTNAVGTTDPMFVARAIGPHIARAIAPYRFGLPVTAHVFGVIPMRGEEGADLRFELEGGAFQWWRLNVPRIAGQIHWLNKTVTLTNIAAECYGGQAAGWTRLDFQPENGTDFAFAVTTTNMLLQALMADLATRTNHLEGLLNGRLAITKANSSDWQTVNGYGELKLRDGLIWDIPLFGIFTPVLESIAPGLGTSRASAASCAFAITNGVARTDDLEMRSPALRLLYRGTVDFQGRVNARVEAELLRDMPLLGPLVSTVFWPVTKLFEYKLTGSLDQPKAQPLFLIPKLVLMPFYPFRTLKGLLPEESGPPQTNLFQPLSPPPGQSNKAPLPAPQ